MIAVLINTQSDTDVMGKSILAHLEEDENNIVMINPKRSELEDVLKKHPNETTMFLGHGSSYGLFSANDDDEEEAIDMEFDYDKYMDDGYVFDPYDLYYNDRFFANYSSPYIIDCNNVDLLRDREVIGIWCYASDFAKKYNLRGFFTYMFVSNPMEACSLNFGEHSKDEVDEQNVIFCNQINNMIREGVEPQDFCDKLNYDKTINFVNFNYSHMIYNYGY